MIESDRSRLKLIQYFPLLIIIILLIRVPFDLIHLANQWFQLLQRLILIGVFIYVYLQLKQKLKFVKLNADKILIEEGNNFSEHTWEDVASINRRFAFYSLKLKSGVSLYFTSQRLISILSADNTPMGILIRSKKEKYNI